MPTTCGFPNCKFRSRYRGQEDNRHFYRIPKRPPQLRQRWLHAIGRTEETVVSQLRICSAHFSDGEKKEGDIPVPDPLIDPPLFITIPPRGDPNRNGNAVARSVATAEQRLHRMAAKRGKLLAQKGITDAGAVAAPTGRRRHGNAKTVVDVNGCCEDVEKRFFNGGHLSATSQLTAAFMAAAAAASANSVEKHDAEEGGDEADGCGDGGALAVSAEEDESQDEQFNRSNGNNNCYYQTSRSRNEQRKSSSSNSSSGLHHNHSLFPKFLQQPQNHSAAQGSSPPSDLHNLTSGGSNTRGEFPPQQLTPLFNLFGMHKGFVSGGGGGTTSSSTPVSSNISLHHLQQQQQQQHHHLHQHPHVAMVAPSSTSSSSSHLVTSAPQRHHHAVVFANAAGLNAGGTVAPALSASGVRPLVALLDGRDCSIEMPLLKDVATVAFCDAQSTTEIHEKVLNEAVVALLYHSISLSRDDLLKFKALKVVVRIGSGVHNVDVNAATELGIAICNTPAECVEETADTTILLILNMYRKTFWIAKAAQQHNGRQMGNVEQLRELVAGSARIRGSTLGIVGFGRVGTAVAVRAKSFGFNVIFFDPYVPSGVERAIGGVERCETLLELASRADCITLHSPLNAETRHLISAEVVQKMRAGAFLVNTCATELVAPAALLAALKTNHIRAAALDVFEQRSGDQSVAALAVNSMENAAAVTMELIAQLPNVIYTPNCAWYSDESSRELRAAAAREVRRALIGNTPADLLNCVNKEALLSATARSVPSAAAALQNLSAAHNNRFDAATVAAVAAAAGISGGGGMGLYELSAMLGMKPPMAATVGGGGALGSIPSAATKPSVTVATPSQHHQQLNGSTTTALKYSTNHPSMSLLSGGSLMSGGNNHSSSGGGATTTTLTPNEMMLEQLNSLAAAAFGGDISAIPSDAFSSFAAAAAAAAAVTSSAENGSQAASHSQQQQAAASTGNNYNQFLMSLNPQLLLQAGGLSGNSTVTDYGTSQSGRSSVASASLDAATAGLVRASPKPVGGHHHSRLAATAIKRDEPSERRSPTSSPAAKAAKRSAAAVANASSNNNGLVAGCAVADVANSSVADDAKIKQEEGCNGGSIESNSDGMAEAPLLQIDNGDDESAENMAQNGGDDKRMEADDARRNGDASAERNDTDDTLEPRMEDGEIGGDEAEDGDAPLDECDETVGHSSAA